MNPKFKTLYFGLAAILTPFVTASISALYRYFLDPQSLTDRSGIDKYGFSPGMAGLLVSLLCANAGLRNGIKEFKSGKRTWDLWVGLILSGVVAGFWIFLVAGEFIWPH